MNIKIEINEKQLIEIIINHLLEKVSELDFDKENLKIKVKSIQNYNSEWETANFKATYTHLNI